MGLTGEIAEGKTETLVGGGVKLDLTRNVPQAGYVQQIVVLVQGIESVEENVDVPAAARGGQVQHTPGILRVDPQPPEGSIYQGTTIFQGRLAGLGGEVVSDLPEFIGFHEI